MAQDGGSNSEIVSLSDEVIAYEDTIRKYAKEYDIEDYVSLLQTIMMQESGEKGNDPMQASKSGIIQNILEYLMELQILSILLKWEHILFQIV